MSGRPLLDMLQASVSVPRGIDGFWSIICKLDGLGRTWTISDIAARTNVHKRNVSVYVQGLTAAGYVIIVSRGPAPRPTFPGAANYRLVKRPAVAPRVTRDGIEHPEPRIETLWRTMKMVKSFTTSELAAHASTDARPMKVGTARAYLRDLLSAGIVAEIKKGKPGSEARYRLVRNLGSRAPKVLSAHIVFDPNTETLIGKATAHEVQL